MPKVLKGLTGGMVLNAPSPFVNGLVLEFHTELVDLSDDEYEAYQEIRKFIKNNPRAKGFMVLAPKLEDQQRVSQIIQKLNDLRLFPSMTSTIKIVK